VKTKPERNQLYHYEHQNYYRAQKIPAPKDSKIFLKLIFYR